MMRYLFLHNVRGFANTYVPILDVNFLVGENSTGKTSVLKILKLISSPRFWLGTEGAFEEVELSRFVDVLSAFSTDGTSFDVGLMHGPGDGNGADVSAFLMTFTERRGMPFLSVFSYLKNGTGVRIRFKGESVRYRKLRDLGRVDLTFLKDELFPRWKQEHAEDESGYRTLNAPKGMPLALLVELIEAGSNNGKKTRERPFSALNDFLWLAFHGDIGWIAPIRTKPKQTYDLYRSEFSSEGEHIPYLIRRLLDRETNGDEFRAFLSEIGKASGLFDGVTIKKYGRGATAPFELDVVLNQRKFSIYNVGYGVSQSLPVIVESFVRERGSWLAIQQPEVHLHPRAQAALGDLFFQLATAHEKRFLIETHSDYIIDRFRTRVRKERERAPASQVLFFERDDNGNKVYPIRIQENGELASDQPESYREFFVKEQLRVLDLE